ncbi:MAG: 5'-methylthioadenosine/adenosylhomocysteine nucleosidase [Culturomica sp.]|jgi:adenosylhomocysteine nucleosidase|nr:5'-methylthioadenosine/adenosylhomocysteine nucleosidase [Culturomica sp.]
MKKIGIIVAMDSEFELVVAMLENKNEIKINHLTILTGNVGDKTIYLARSGMGKVNSAVATLEMIHNCEPEAIINTGVAGGIDKSLNVADIVVGEKTVYHDVWCGEGYEYGRIDGCPLYFNANVDMYAKAMQISGDITIKGGLICSGDRFITGEDELKKIKSDFPEGLAVDMESCSIAQVCYLFKVPFLSFRIISDTPGIENHLGQYEDFWKLAPQKSFYVLKNLLIRL